MKLKVQVEDQDFNIYIGEDGLNDFAWLAQTAAKLYGKKIYPNGNYIPALLKCYDTIPHPRTKLIHFIKDNGIEYFTPGEGEEVNTTFTFNVEIQKKNMKKSKEHIDWFNKAFGRERNLMTLHAEYIQYKTDTQIKKKDPNVGYMVDFQYTIFKDLKNEYKDYSEPKQYTIPMTEEITESAIKYRAEIQLPYGEISPNPPNILYYRKNNEDLKPQKINTSQNQSEVYNFQIDPKPISQEDIQKKIKARMAIPPSLSEKLLQQEQEIKKEVNTDDSLNLFQFLEIFDSENIRTESAATTIDNSIGITFPEFIEIIIKVVNYQQVGILMSNEESLDMSLERAINQIVTIDSQDAEFNEFHKHMKYNITLMTFIRDNSQQLQSIFLEKLHDSSLDNKKFHLLQEQIKSLIIDAGFKGDNLDDIVSTCLTQLINEDKYSGFEGIFYYEFLQVMQWLSLVLITDQDDEEDKQDEEEDPEHGVEQLIEKFKFFLVQFQK
ncbi:hypothetical protein PPERSA_05727 [Pseudocohnilembus persalinus]|uniref:Uncharacterized protein n=1 Tax=Pseudocohnilembus persalinus TaxID=266149 RepID=A0A0V0QIQ4_PSEPJ|nr:hypothetical protein PPERSA_05727 [Pseudocohnilembus persalinus]|eukprot:KRX01888.1 hypothetical protein PPERSA_05727 [Pseudocohnilembus persalinus]